MKRRPCHGKGCNFTHLEQTTFRNLIPTWREFDGKCFVGLGWLIKNVWRAILGSVIARYCIQGLKTCHYVDVDSVGMRWLADKKRNQFLR